MTHFWLRHEVKPFEGRTILLPEHVKQLLEKGHKVTVERSNGRAVKDEEYEAIGATMVPQESWVKDAPEDAIICGLKELPEDGEKDAFPIKHSHIYFAHCFKLQDNWEHVMRRFLTGGGKLFDIEFMTDEDYRRVAGFSRIAGFVGMALAGMALAHQVLHPNEPMPPVHRYETYDELCADVRAQLEKANIKPRVLVMGALGRSGRGAVDCAERIGILDENLAKWDLEETKAGGPFKEIMEYDIMVNCILLTSQIPPFINNDLLKQPGRKLRVLSDVSCDPNNPYNPVPIYHKITYMDKPTIRVMEAENENPAVDVVAIDHMPSMVPRAASEEMGGALLPHIIDFDKTPMPVPWRHALDKFEEIAKKTPM